MSSLPTTLRLRSDTLPSMNPRVRWSVLVLAAASTLAIGCRDSGADAATPAPVMLVPTTSTATPIAPSTRTPTPEPSVDFVPVLHRVVDKENALPADYVPDDLEPVPGDWLMPGAGGVLVREEALGALDELMEAAVEDGVDLRVRSAYRSYSEQEWTYAYWAGLLGEAQASRESARAGHSEHQLGTTIDFASAENGYELIESFGQTSEGIWLAQHAVEYGFALSYPPDGEQVTGYISEPWHYRYIGREAAGAWAESGDPLVVFLEDLAQSS